MLAALDRNLNFHILNRDKNFGFSVLDTWCTSLEHRFVSISATASRQSQSSYEAEFLSAKEPVLVYTVYIYI